MVRAFLTAALGVMLAGAAYGGAAPQAMDYPDPDTEKACAAPGESPQCAAKTFWLCSEKSIATCKLAGLNVQADGTQHKQDDTLEGEAWIKPWTLSWTQLLDVTHKNYSVWQIEGVREVTGQRLRGVPGSRRALTGSHEMMIKMVNTAGIEERESVFLVQRKGQWFATGFAIWRNGELVSACEKRKLGSLACRYTVNGLTPW